MAGSEQPSSSRSGTAKQLGWSPVDSTSHWVSSKEEPCRIRPSPAPTGSLTSHPWEDPKQGAKAYPASPPHPSSRDSKADRC